jgi:hypothetical protein
LEEPRNDRPDYVNVGTDFLFNRASWEKGESSNISDMLYFRRSEVKRQLSFKSFIDLHGNKEFGKPFKFFHLNLTFRFNQNERLATKESRYLHPEDDKIYAYIDKQFLEESSRLLSAYKSNISSSDIDPNGVQIAQLWFNKRLLEIIYDSVENRPDPKEDLKGAFQKRISSKDISVYQSVNLWASFKNFFEYLDIFKNGKQQKEFNKKYESVTAVLNKPVPLINKEYFYVDTITGQTLLELEEELLSCLPYPVYNSIFEFDWEDLSTGEKALLNLFSRINHAHTVWKEKELKPGKRLVSLLVDEPSTGFHPQWQKEYLAKLLEFLRLRFPDEYLDVIIATHSPYLVSDLQKEDVVFIGDKNSQPQYKHDNTFGANIHELLADGFYLENGFMGDFARTKIKSLISFLSSKHKKYAGWSKESSKKFISIIGEPLLKNDLEELYYAKFKDQAEIEAEIERLTKLKDGLK